MGFSPLADMSRRIPQQNRYNIRNSPISGFTIHHNAGVNSYGEATSPNREVSAHYWITNEGVILPQVDEIYRAWTTGASGYPAGAQSDHRNITVEVSNSPEGVRDGTWAISTEAYNALVALIADVFERHNLGAVRRGTHGGVAVHRDFVPTECPGPYIMANLSRIISDANAGANQMTPEQEKKVIGKLDWIADILGGSVKNGPEGNITNRLRRIEALSKADLEVSEWNKQRLSGSNSSGPSITDILRDIQNSVQSEDQANALRIAGDLIGALEEQDGPGELSESDN